MNRTIPTTLAALAALLWTLALATGMSGCAPSPKDADPDAVAASGAKPADPAGHADAAPAGDPDDASLFDLDLAFTDSEGAPRRLADLRGRTIVAAMMYSNCKTACPMLAADMKMIEGRLPPDVLDRTTFLVVSLDPRHDSPERLKAYAAEQGFDAARWVLLATDEDGVRTLAAALGVKYVAAPSGEISHSAVVFLIDGYGVVRAKQEGSNHEPGALAGEVTALVRARGV